MTPERWREIVAWRNVEDGATSEAPACLGGDGSAREGDAARPGAESSARAEAGRDAGTAAAPGARASAIRCPEGAARSDPSSADVAASRTSRRFGADFAELRAALRADHARLAGPGGGGARFLRDAALHKTYRMVCSYRLHRFARTARARWLRALIPAAAAWHRLTCLSVGAEIAWQAEIGPGFRVLHGFGVVILPSARIGANVTLAHGACVGYRAAPEAPRIPLSVGVVEDDCFVGPFSFVWARLGRGSVLGPLSLLREDAPPGSVLAGAPARRLRGLGEGRDGGDAAR